LFEYALRMAGFDVSAAADGMTALRALDQHVIPDVVVLDLDLPQVSGIDLHQEILSHAETRSIPIIVVTGTNWPTLTGVFRTLRKPIPSDVVVTAVQRALARDAHDAGDNDRQGHEREN
jgi:CheY-like chemotaxis protein